jgi:DNA (cytosine-5)-methyltransferase 1
MADERGNLALEYLRLAGRIGARWLVWENVPGVLSSNGGRDFGSFLGGLAQLGYGFAYRVLDAQFFGVPQRRRRVFVVGYLGDWRRAAAVLFERHSLQGHHPPSREAGERTPQGVAGSLNSSVGRGTGGAHETDFLTITHSLRGEGFDASEDGTGRGTPLVPVDWRWQCEFCGSRYVVKHSPCPCCLRKALAPIAFTSKDHGADASDIAPTLRAMGHGQSHANGGGQVAVAFAQNQLGEVRAGDVVNTLNTNANASGRNTPMIAFGWQNSASQGDSVSEHVTPGLDKSKVPAVAMRSAVRRLTPREAERLQGFPDDHTLVPYRGKPAADGPRYKALGNSMAVPCMRLIGERIAMVDAIVK